MRTKAMLMALLCGGAPVAAETTLFDVSKLPSKTVHDVAQLSPLAVAWDRAPVAGPVSFERGDVQVQLVMLDAEPPIQAVQEQMK